MIYTYPLFGLQGRNQIFDYFERVPKWQYTQQTPLSFAGDIGAAIAAFFTNMIENSSMARAAEVRGAQIDALNAKTDTELAVMGLRRDEIPAYVFRDLMYI
jgi:hypothetical protein